MGVRVSQRSMFASFVGNMNMSLANLMESNMQASSQKKINRPSDDSIGAARILGFRDTLSSITQHQKNIKDAKGWLALADKTLTQVNTVLTRAKALAEQAATGTLDAHNRDQISYELRQLQKQLMNLANTSIEGKHIFAGHKTEEPPFVEALSLHSNDPNISNASFHITGAATKTHLVQFSNAGQIGVTAPINYRYSKDGGVTWQNGTPLGIGDTELDLGGVSVQLTMGQDVAAVNMSDPHDKLSNGDPNGTWLYIHPTMQYMGDDKDAPPEIGHFGSATLNSAADGVFTNDVMVRIDSATDLASRIEYSYSLDNGTTWVTGNITSNAGTPGNASLPVPGGFLKLSSNSGNALANGDQYYIHPRRANIDFEISPGSNITVNSVGKDVFGGIYQSYRDEHPTPVRDGEGSNMFEAMGRLIAFTESNNQQGVQEALADIGKASKVILTHAANVGGRENRLTVAENVLGNLKLDSKDRLSNIEDVDVAELMTKLAQQQLVYNSVLKSSATIMQMNLSNFI